MNFRKHFIIEACVLDNALASELQPMTGSLRLLQLPKDCVIQKRAYAVMIYMKLLSSVQWRHQCSSLLSKRIVKGHHAPLLCALPVFNHRNPVRLFTTTWPKWKDAPQPKEPESGKLDLDIWKSILRSQGPVDEVPTVNASLNKTEGKTSDSPLDATRELVDMWRLAGKQVPEDITDEQLETVAGLSTKSAKKKYLKYLAMREVVKKADKAKKERRRTERLAGREVMDNDDGEDSKLRNTFIMQFWQRSLDKVLGWRSAQSMLFGQSLVFDMSYEQHMSRRELENTIKQLMETEGCNRRAVDPFHLHFCNLNPEGAYQKEFLKRYGPETWDNLMVTTSHKDYIDIFPRDQLVYLTADSPNVLRRFDHDKVYIIGALVDRSILPGVSLANAKRLKLSTARLPLDEHLHWGCGAKNLCLDQMFRILMTVKETGNWTKAFTFVPQRKHDGFHNARKSEGDSGKQWKADVLQTEELKTLFLSKQRSKGGVNNANSHQIPKMIESRNKFDMPSQHQRSKKNWWEDN